MQLDECLDPARAGSQLRDDDGQPLERLDGADQALEGQHLCRQQLDRPLEILGLKHTCAAELEAFQKRRSKSPERAGAPGRWRRRRFGRGWRPARSSPMLRAAEPETSKTTSAPPAAARVPRASATDLAPGVDRLETELSREVEDAWGPISPPAMNPRPFISRRRARSVSPIGPAPITNDGIVGGDPRPAGRRDRRRQAARRALPGADRPPRVARWDRERPAPSTTPWETPQACRCRR